MHYLMVKPFCFKLWKSIKVRNLHPLAIFNVCIMHVNNGNKALFFLILGLRIFLKNIKVGGGKKIKIKITKNIFFI